MRRNKRCLLAYHRVRTDKLEELCWKGVDLISGDYSSDGPARNGSVEASDASKSSLSPEEEEYIRLYGDLLAAYKGQWTDIDLTGSLEPPRDLFIDVRVLKDAGEIQTEYGYGTELHVSELSLTHTQRHQLDQEQPILCSTRRCRETDTARISSEAGLRHS